jgi:hypothetical protein
LVAVGLAVGLRPAVVVVAAALAVTLGWWWFAQLAASEAPEQLAAVVGSGMETVMAAVQEGLDAAAGYAGLATAAAALEDGAVVKQAWTDEWAVAGMLLDAASELVHPVTLVQVSISKTEEKFQGL